MKKNYRRALLFAAILIFMAVTPVVILYALGYRTGFTSADPLPVGVLLIETEPSQADVYLDDIHVGQTPYSISRPAGMLTIRLEKDGYASWHKQLTIRSGRATEVRDVRLFPTELTPTPVTAAVRSFVLSPNRRLVAVVHTDGTVTVYDQAGEVVIPPQRFSGRLQDPLWSPNSDALLLTTTAPAEVWHLEIADRALAKPQKLPLTGATSLVWDPRIPGRILYLDHDHTLQAYNVQSGAHAPLILNVTTFTTSATNLYSVEHEPVLTEYTLQGKATGQTIPLPEGSLKQLLVTPQGTIALLTTDGRVWITTDDETFEQIASGMASLAWSPSGKVLLLNSDSAALYVYNVNDKRTTLPLHDLHLVQRLSRPITNAQWFAGGRHIVYHVDDEIWITETDTRDYPVAYQVDTTNTGSAGASVGEEGETIFYIKNIKGIPTLVSASLLAE